MPDARLLHLVSASLLHDIGSFIRMGRDAPRDVMRDLPLPAELEDARSRLAELAAASDPDAADFAARCIARAAPLALGLDGASPGRTAPAGPDSRMRSILASVSLGTPGPAPDLRHRPAPIDGDMALFPVTEKEACASGMAEQADGFLRDLRDPGLLRADRGPAAWLGSLHAILERWTWCVPAGSSADADDVSLFDHNRVTAAVAQALHAGGDVPDPRFILFGGELSGIQKYVFSSGERPDKGAGKLLRARSFMLQMLTRSVWTALLDRCGLLHAARIMDAGGRFILLLPGTDDVRAAIAALEEEAEDFILRRFRGVLRLTCAFMDLSAADLDMRRFQDAYEEFNNRMERARMRPFSRLMAREGGLDVFLEAPGAFADHGECDACGFRPADRGEDGRALCGECADLIRLGGLLPNAAYAVLRRGGGEGGAVRIPLFGGLFLELVPEGKEPPRDPDADILNLGGGRGFLRHPAAGLIPRVSKDDAARWEREGRFGADRGGEMAFDGDPIRHGMPLTFGMLAELSRIPCDDGSWRSPPFLAALKADVDDLGLIFSVGLGSGAGSRFSVSRFAGLSRMLHEFFSAWLPRVAEESFPGIYVVFAGGDDLFVLGPWDDALRFALRMRRDFRAFAGNVPDVTISAGVTLFRPRMPVRAVRGPAERDLETAKEHVRPAKDGPGRAKDAVTAFGVTASWEELEANIGLSDALEERCLKGALTQGFVRRILGYMRECRKFNTEGRMDAGLYLSHMQYDIARNCDERRTGADFLARLKTMPCDKDAFPGMEPGVIRALYRTRKAL